uniref:Uncharacterized protein n=1 Tax=Anguilla anguilla TaxID=7936 RepID=A0A0E9Q9N6_ANGAN
MLYLCTAKIVCLNKCFRLVIYFFSSRKY